MKFSERQGFVKVKDAIQNESMDSKLKADLYNYLHTRLDIIVQGLFAQYGYSHADPEEQLLEKIATDFFHEPDYRKEDSVPRLLQRVFGMKFYETYDFLEFCVQKLFNSDPFNDIDEINHILSENNSGYRFINNQLEPVSSKIDTNNLESSLKVSIDEGHLQRALNELGKRKDANTNTILKESIDAVEIATRTVTTTLFTGKPDDTLGASIKILTKNHFMEDHKAYLEAMSKLYGYASDGGIRHPKQRDHVPDQAEAVFMLEICSAFISLLNTKFADWKSKK